MGLTGKRLAKHRVVRQISTDMTATYRTKEGVLGHAT
jgi:hypothetical protein